MSVPHPKPHRLPALPPHRLPALPPRRLRVLPPRRRWDSDAGRVSIFITIAFTGLLMIFGVAVDASGQLRTLVRADNLAAEAARAAGQAIDIEQVAATGEHRVDPALAVDYAQRYLTEADHNEPDMSFTVAVISDDQLQITVELPYRNRVLGIFGRGDVMVTGRATAVLVSDG